MDKRKKSARTPKPKSVEAKTSPDFTADVGGLGASLEALAKIAEQPDDKNAGEIVQLPAGKNKGRDQSPGTAKELVDELDEKYANSNDRLVKKGSKTQKEAKENSPEAIGVVELLGALKSDIDSLRQDNDEFKAELMDRDTSRDGSKSDNSDVRVLLESLKADIGNLRHETDDLRSRSFSDRSQSDKVKETAALDEDQKLFSMLAELKDDIVSLRTENEALRHGDMALPAARSSQKRDQVTEILYELKSDLNELKHENESLRLEKLTARDGARFDHLGGQSDAYRNTQSEILSSIIKGVGALILVAGAAGGGYYLAKSQSGGASGQGQSTNIASRPGALYQRLDPAQPFVKTAPEKASPLSPRPPQPAITTPAVEKSASSSLSISLDVEAAMIARADGLLSARDLGAARMVFVYLARHGSASAMNRLAQTYDPQYLVSQRFDAVKSGDLARAARLYNAASNMGNTDAIRRLQELQ